MRLNRYLAQCGLGSRRAVEKLVGERRVTLNGRLVEHLGIQVDAGEDQVVVDGRPVRLPDRPDYLMLNKPAGFEVTRSGRHAPRRVYELLPKGIHPSVQAVGRLDRESTGLLLFSNDGALNFRLTHPRHGCQKVYEVEVEGEVADQTLQKLTAGLTLEDGPARAVGAERLAGVARRGTTRLRLAMAEGRKRIVRRLSEAAGHRVLRLHRTALGPLELGELPSGRVRALTDDEVGKLQRSVGLELPH